ncbi:MAG: hypothetical protein QOH06_5138 [Acidobacteriota bacterium]|jgi:membrane associated rhomboid family serine protease|nr:hypothetical protein [Acidobacteriota bacterium]
MPVIVTALTVPALVLRWTAAWFVLGLGAGVALLARDTADFPWWLLPPLVGVAAAVAGLLASLLFLAARAAIGRHLLESRWRLTLVAAVAGIASMMCLAAPFGVRYGLAAVAGAVAGAVSALVSGVRRGA